MNKMNKPFLTAQDCAEMMGIQTQTFLRNYAPLPTFPRRITLPRSRKPLWESEEVIGWVRKFKES